MFNDDDLLGQLEEYAAAHPREDAEVPLEDSGQTRLSAERLLEYGDDERIKQYTNFNCNEFATLWSVVQPAIDAMKEGGNISKYTNKTWFLITLLYLKNACSKKFLGDLIVLTAGHAGRTIHAILDAIHQPLLLAFMRFTPHQALEAAHQVFTNFPYAVGAIDASVTEIPRPPGSIQREYYSGKHKYHCVKIGSKPLFSRMDKQRTSLAT